MAFIFFPQYQKGRKGIKIHPGLTILDYIRKAGIEINSVCGGNGTCGKCVVRIDKGAEYLNRLTTQEQKFSLDNEERLACQARVITDKQDITVFIKSFGTYEILKYGMEKKVPLCPVFEKKDNFVTKNELLVDEYKGKIYGLAIDLGTTTIVFDLVDLETGDILATIAKTNPQISYGNDVISRIDYCMIDREQKEYTPEAKRMEKIRDLQKLVVKSINNSLKELSVSREEDITPYIYDVVVVGNPTMRNIFFGIDVASLGVIPFDSVHKEHVVTEPANVGLNMNPKGQIYGAALIGGHIGADTLANVLASELYKQSEVSMLVDIGTNGEVVIGNNNKILAASAAAGGAFEGAMISCGVGGITGAIKSVEIVDGRIVYSTIGNKFPIGVCGSGLIDLLAELLNHELMSKNARIKQDFLITDNMKIIQEDIFQLITSKAALKTTENILLKHYPAESNSLNKVYLSGGFGNFINIRHAINIGLIPDVPEGSVIKIGNGSLEGAREMLLCTDRRELGESLAKKITHISTNEVEKDFDYLMATNMYFE